MEEQKPCAECRFYVPPSLYIYGGLYCTRYAHKVRDLVDGRVYLKPTKNPYEVRASADPEMCGPEGRHFEQKRAWWKFWKRGE